MTKPTGYPPNFKPTAKFTWLDGEIVPWEDARIHVSCPAIAFGASVFEGIRVYWNEAEEELYVFRLGDHLDRLANSMKMLRLTIPFNREDLFNGVLEITRRNGWREDAYASTYAYLGLGERFSIDPERVYMGAWINSMRMPRAGTVQTGLNCCISSWERNSDNIQPPRIKASANYLVFRLASVQARLDNYDETILLNHEGKVTEAPGSCIFMVRDGVACTPPVTSNILEGITRETLLKLLPEELGIPTVERTIDRTELYIADEILLCGTGKEIAPVVSMDRHLVADGTPGPVTRRIQDLYFDIVRGKVPKFRDWLTPVYHA